MGKQHQQDQEPPLHIAVSAATAELAAAGVPSPRVDAELLAAHLLDVSTGELRAALILADRSLCAPAGYPELVAQRAARIPLQHLTGVANFRYLELHVGPGVFIPRPETETLAQLAIDAAKDVDHPRVVDLGTGSGAIAGSIAYEVPQAEVHAVELGELAHAWAERNLLPLGVKLVRGDLRTAFAELNGTADVVVSNPPYIPADAIPREPEVADHDPAMALYGGGTDGLELPRAAIATAARLLKPGGVFVLEHAEVQATTLRSAIAESPLWRDVTTHRDLNGSERATSAIRTDQSAHGMKGPLQ